MDYSMKSTLFDARMMKQARDAMDLMTNVLQASTEHSIIGTGLDGGIVLWNEGAHRTYGYEADEVVGKANSEILHTPEDVALGRPKEILAAALREGKWEGVIGRIRKDGRRIQARVVITPRLDAAGKPIGFLLISKDVSNELRFTEHIRKVKLFDSAIVSNAREAVDFIANILEPSTEYSVIGKDLDGKILLWNEGARRRSSSRRTPSSSRPSCGCATPASALRRTCCPGSSRLSRRRTPPWTVAREVSDWDSRWSKRSSKCTAAR